MLAGKNFDSSFILASTALGGGERVAGRRQQHGEAGGRLAVQPGLELVAQAADLDPRDIAQPHGRSVGVGAQGDRAEFLRRGELALDQHQRGDFLRVRARLGADAAGGDLGVLRRYRLVDVVGGQPVADQLRRIDPDAQAALGGIERGTADAGNAPDFAEHVADHEIAEADFIETVVGRAQRDDLQHRAGSFLDQNALLDHRARQPRLDALETVLHLDRGLARSRCPARSWR